MSDLLQFLTMYGYLVVFGTAFTEQMGLPVPTVPFIIGMGALSRTGEASFFAIMATAGTAALIADLIWYQLGRRHADRGGHAGCRRHRVERRDAVRGEHVHEVERAVDPHQLVGVVLRGLRGADGGDEFSQPVHRERAAAGVFRMGEGSGMPGGELPD